MRTHPLLASLVWLLLANAGCIAWNPWTPEEPLPDPETLQPSRAVRLAPGDTHAGELACPKGFCQQWYRIDVPQPGTLIVEVAVAVETPPRARVVLHDGAGQVLARASTEQGTTLRVEASVGAGAAALLVQTGKGLLPYTVSARLE